MVGNSQQPRRPPHRITDKTAVARLLQQRTGDRACQPDDFASFDFPLTPAGQQDAFGRFPRLGLDRAGRPAKLLEKHSGQDRLCWQAIRPVSSTSWRRTILRQQPAELGMLVQPLRHRLQLAADFVIGEEVEYPGLDGAFLHIVGSRGVGFALGFTGVIPKGTRKPPPSILPIFRFSK